MRVRLSLSGTFRASQIGPVSVVPARFAYLKLVSARVALERKIAAGWHRRYSPAKQKPLKSWSASSAPDSGA
jgi:hypothetical protein